MSTEVPTSGPTTAVAGETSSPTISESAPTTTAPSPSPITTSPAPSTSWNPSNFPTVSPRPTVTPSPSTSLQPSYSPSAVPTTSPPTVSPRPSATPTAGPSNNPTQTPSPTETMAPSPSPSEAPTNFPTVTGMPSPMPSLSFVPTSGPPSEAPSGVPTIQPTTLAPSAMPSILMTMESRNKIEMVLLGIELSSVNPSEWITATSEHVKTYWNTLDSLDVVVGDVATDLKGFIVLVPGNSTTRRRRLLAPVLQFQYSQTVMFGVEEGKNGPETRDSLFTRPFRMEAQPYLDVLRNLTGTTGDVGFGSITIRDFEPAPTPAPAPPSNPISDGQIVGLVLGILAGIAVLFVVVWWITRRPHLPSVAEYDANQASFDTGEAGPVVVAPPPYGVSESNYEEYSREPDVPSSAYQYPPQSIVTPAVLDTAEVDHMASTSDSEMPDFYDGSTAKMTPEPDSQTGVPVVAPPPLLASPLEEDMGEGGEASSFEVSESETDEEEPRPMTGFEMQINDIEEEEDDDEESAT